MSGCSTHYNTQDGYSLFYGRPMDDVDDNYDCRTQDHLVPASRLLSFIHYILWTIGVLFFGFKTTSLAWIGICTNVGNQSQIPPNVVQEMECKSPAEGYHMQPFIPSIITFVAASSVTQIHDQTLFACNITQSHFPVLHATTQSTYSREQT
ncbi:hypothetical protein BG003_007171 [Podila horticola]|nr:hypothetical protein BG003_007171 [Podila horticola]